MKMSFFGVSQTSFVALPQIYYCSLAEGNRYEKTPLNESFTLELRMPRIYNFELTVHKPAGWWCSAHDEKFENGTFWSATRFGGALLGLKLKSVGNLTTPIISCTVFSAKKIGEPAKQVIEKMLRRALRLDEDLTQFYNLAKKDEILKVVTKVLNGMYSVAWPELFPALILAVTLQMAPMKRSNQMMELLVENFGEEACFDHSEIRYWPSSKRIALTTEGDLKGKAKLGYRANNLISISKNLEAGFPSMGELNSMQPEKAKKKLMTLRGIGDYSAELIIPGMGFPLDVWSAKIFGVLFSRKVPDDPRKAIPGLKEIAEKRWGKWMGYAFVYVLNDLSALSENVGFDLTHF
jgi:DNA-3-methyladenine glycosylase II